jgi:hypothetical protein
MPTQTRTPTAVTQDKDHFPGGMYAWEVPPPSGEYAHPPRGGGLTYLLKLDGCRFDPPAGKAVAGLAFTLARRASQYSGDFQARDEDVRLLVGGVPVGPNLRDTSPYGTAFAPVTYTVPAAALPTAAQLAAGVGVGVMVTENSPEGAYGFVSVKDVVAAATFAE